MEKKKTSKSYSPEVRERAIRMVSEHLGEHASEWAALVSISGKIGCIAETLRSWVRQSQRDEGLRAGVTTSERYRQKALERENRELRQANEILRKASGYFAQAFARASMIMPKCPVETGAISAVFYLSNRHALSVIFDRELGEPDRMATWERHVVRVTLATVQYRKRGESA